MQAAHCQWLLQDAGNLHGRVQENWLLRRGRSRGRGRGDGDRGSDGLGKQTCLLQLDEEVYQGGTYTVVACVHVHAYVKCA